MEFGSLIGIFLNSANLICRSMDISRSVLEGPFDFEITRVDCTLLQVVTSLCLYKHTGRAIVPSPALVFAKS